MFLKSIYFATNTLCDTIYITRVKTTTSLSTQVTSSGSYYKKGVRTNLPIYVSFTVISFTSFVASELFIWIVYTNSGFYFIQSIQSRTFISCDVCAARCHNVLTTGSTHTAKQHTHHTV
jgi:hypothetical protein